MARRAAAVYTLAHAARYTTRRDTATHLVTLAAASAHRAARYMDLAIDAVIFTMPAATLRTQAARIGATTPTAGARVTTRHAVGTGAAASAGALIGSE